MISERNILGFIMLSGLVALAAKLSLLKNPTIEGVRVLEDDDDVSLFNLERGWHWFARRYQNGTFSKPWHTTRDAARRGMHSAPAWSELWGFDEKNRRWVQDRLITAKYR